MTTDPAPLAPASPPAAAPAVAPTAAGLAALGAAHGFARAALSPATQRAYRADWAHFEVWCAGAGFPALPAAPEAVAAYLADHARLLGRAALRRRLAAIGGRHRMAGHAPPTGQAAVRATLRGLLRQTAAAPPRRAAALGTAELRRLVAACPGDLAGLRDRALLLLGYAAALRRAELVAVEREHLVLEGGGLRLLIPRSKGDPEGEGAWVGLPRGTRRETCPVRALEAWLEASGCRSGPVFRRIDCWGHVARARLHPDAVRQILRRRAAAAGLSVPALERLSPHVLRAGFVTEAYKAGARDEEIMAHTRHRDLKTMRGYVRRAKLGPESPARLLGL
jgi:integrase